MFGSTINKIKRMQHQVSREEIEETKVFQDLPTMKQFFVKKKENVNWLKHNFTVASYLGWNEWLAQSENTTQINKDIIHELLTKNL